MVWPNYQPVETQYVVDIHNKLWGCVPKKELEYLKERIWKKHSQF